MSSSTAPSHSEEQSPGSECPRFSITLDSAHFREHWAEMVADRMPNTRSCLRYSALFGLVALLLFQPFDALADWTPRSRLGAVIAATLSIVSCGMYVSKRHSWLTVAKRHPRFGQEVDFLISGGQLVQRPGASEPAFKLADAALHGTRRGYFVRGALAEDHGLGPNFEPSGSVYLPHRSLRPPMSREELMALIAED